jgi:hypothetical protein
MLVRMALNAVRRPDGVRKPICEGWNVIGERVPSFPGGADASRVESDAGNRWLSRRCASEGPRKPS